MFEYQVLQIAMIILCLQTHASTQSLASFRLNSALYCKSISQSEIIDGLSIIMLGFLGDFEGFSWGCMFLWRSCIPQNNRMKIIRKFTTLILCAFFSQLLFRQYRMIMYNKFMKNFRVCFLRKKEGYPNCVLYALIVHYAVKTIEDKTQFNTTHLKVL